MPERIPKYPYSLKDVRKELSREELRTFVQPEAQEGGLKRMPEPAKRFARRFSETVSHYPKKKELPNWFRAMVERKASVEELTKTLHDHLYRAPSKENQELALIVANQIARMKGGSEVLPRYVTPELLSKLSGRGGQ
jgi:hypothetical protein